ncbi:MAG: glycosyltransferase [Alphaproteobacteria bacterium]|nr:glycosyltransferase [Alphaproteobacteria bacterium]
MKILYHHRTVSKDGQDVHITELINAFRQQGHEVIVVSPPAQQDAEFGSGGGRFDLIKKYIPRALYEILEFGYSVVAYRRLRAAYVQHKPDFLYERYSLFLMAGKWLNSRYGIPYILEVNAPLTDERISHDGLVLHRFARWAESSVWRAADHVLPVTDKLADYVRHAGVPEPKIQVVPNGINTAMFSSDASGEEARRELGLSDKIVLGFTGFMRSWHGLTRVVDAMLAMPERADLHFLVVGDGPARAELEAYAAEKGVADRVTTLGLVARDRVSHYVSTFDVALQPSVVAYASPLKLFEYMALGRAIVAPDQGNIREVLSDGEDAILFDPDDTDAFTAAIVRLCRDDALRNRLGAAAAALIESKPYTWSANAQRVIALAENDET